MVPVELLDGLLAICGAGHPVVFTFKISCDCLANRLLVLHQEDAASFRTHVHGVAPFVIESAAPILPFALMRHPRCSLRVTKFQIIFSYTAFGSMARSTTVLVVPSVVDLAIVA